MLSQSLLINISPFLLLFILVFVFAAVNILCTYLFRWYIKRKNISFSYKSNGEFFGLLGGIYGLLLGFVVFWVYNGFNDAQAKANQEQSLARSLYREIKYYPDSLMTKPLMNVYIKYIHSVIDEEYPQMEKLQPFNKSNRVYLDNVYREMEKLNSVDTKTAGMISHLNDMAMYRGLRQLSAFSDIPFAIWLPLMLGYLILLLCSLFLEIESMRMHLFLTGMLGVFIGLVVYIIVIVNHPFSGTLKIEPEVFQTILQMQEEKN